MAFAGTGGGDRPMRFGWWGNPLRNTQTTAVLNMFTAQTGIDVDEVVTGWGDYWPMLLTLAPAGNLPDVIQQDVAWLMQFAQNNLLVDLSPFFADGRIDVTNIPPAIREAGRVGGGIYAIPIGMNVAAMVYNRTLLNSLGLTAPRNMTLDQFVNLSREVYARSGVRTNWAFNDPFNQMTAHLRAQGLPSMFTPTGMAGTAAHYVEFFNVIATGIAEGWHIRAEHMAGRDGMPQDPLVYPAGAANVNMRAWNSPVWSNMIAGLQSAAGAAVELGMTTYPSTNPPMSNFGRASMFLSITTHARNPNQAAQLINFWLNHQPAHDIMLAERGVIPNTVIQSAVAPRLSPGMALQSEFVSWVNQPGNSSPFNALAPEGFGQIQNELEVVTELVAMGQLTPTAAAQRFFDFGNSVLR
jgi:multiple sugar transport system substrate-binding protein